MTLKDCPACGATKPTTEFYKDKQTRDGFTCYCKICCNRRNAIRAHTVPVEKQRAASRRYYHMHKEKLTAASRRWRTAHPEKVVESRRRYYAAHSDKVHKWSAQWAMSDSPRACAYRLARCIRARLRDALFTQNAQASDKASVLLGCSSQEARAYLTSLFTEGMTWENYGQWHIDHIRPCASFDLTDPEQQKQCFHYTNLQPLWELDNKKKGAKWEPVT